jgi:hypothetical protein
VAYALIRPINFVLATVVIGSCCEIAHAGDEKEPAALVELGAAGESEIRGASGFGPSAAVEFSPTKNFEIEAGVTPLFGGQGRTDWDFELMFRRPFDLSKTLEFEPGIGPTLNGSGQVGVAASTELMIWPWPDRKLGFFIDPSYGVSLAAGHAQSLGITAGILIPIPAN